MPNAYLERYFPLDVGNTFHYVSPKILWENSPLGIPKEWNYPELVLMMRMSSGISLLVICLLRLYVWWQLTTLQLK